MTETALVPTAQMPCRGDIVQFTYSAKSFEIPGSRRYDAVVLASRFGDHGIPIADLWVVTNEGPEGGVLQLGVPHKLIRRDPDTGNIDDVAGTWRHPV